MTKKNKNQNNDKILDKEQIQKIIKSKLNKEEKKEIRIYIDKNIGLLAYRFCPHEFFQLVSRYQDKFFSDKLRKKIKRKYKKSKFDIIADKYQNLYEEYFYKSLYFMSYFKSKVGSSYFNSTAEKLFDDYKFAYDLNIQTRTDTGKYILPFIISTFSSGLSVFLKENVKTIGNYAIGDYAILFPPIILGIIIFCLGVIFEDNAYDSRLFTKLLQDEFDNNK